MNNQSKDIGILTLQFSNNYGAMYQVYALSQYLGSLGCKVTIINYHMDSPQIETYLKNPISFVKKLIARNAFSIKFFRSRNQIVKSYVAEEKMQAIFDEFRSEFLNITQDIYSYEKLKNAKFTFDTIVVGSDQVWAADFVFSSPAYLLAFVGKEVKKIAYAPSFGKRKLEGYLKSSFKRYSSNIEFLSVRESSGVSLIKELTGRAVPKVVDPTLLLDSYEQIVSDKIVPEKEYLVCYHLDQEINLAQWFIESVKDLSVKLKLDVVYVSPNTELVNAPWESVMPTPGELLGLIKNASLVVTNSFHGTVFSILFETRFFTFARDAHKEKQNLRMKELVSTVGLDDHFVGPFECEYNIDSCIDWESVKDLLEVEKNKSAQFLLNALGFEK